MPHFNIFEPLFIDIYTTFGHSAYIIYHHLGSWVLLVILQTLAVHISNYIAYLRLEDLGRLILQTIKHSGYIFAIVFMRYIALRIGERLWFNRQILSRRECIWAINIETEIGHYKEVVPQFVGKLRRITQHRVKIAHNGNYRLRLVRTLVSILNLEQGVYHLLDMTTILGNQQRASLVVVIFIHKANILTNINPPLAPFSIFLEDRSLPYTATTDAIFGPQKSTKPQSSRFMPNRVKRFTFGPLSECKNSIFLQNIKMAKVLILEQSKSVRNNLRERLEFEGFSTEGAETASLARKMCENIAFDIILADNAEGIADTKLPFIILSRNNDIDSAVEAVRHGAVDFLTKPIDMNRLLKSIRKHIAPPAETAPSAPRPKSIRAKNSAECATIEPIVGESEEIIHVRRLIDKVARSEARVLITGENGTGKELVARWLHCKSSRAEAPFVEVNCAAIPSELIESELFGHERGAFTSAIKQRKGKFEQADGGTLFMDEIGDMSLSAQAKVLRALQERKISRVGSDHDIEVDVRVIAATNKNLEKEIREGNFREDLYHRIGVILIKVPPLRERKGDVSILVNHFLKSICQEYCIPTKHIEDEAVTSLSKKHWSGNIRELRNVIERLVVLSGEEITKEDIERYC